MSLTVALAHEFSSTSRHRGEDYADRGAVTITRGSGTEVVAVVRGSAFYRSTITRHNDETGVVEFVAWCQCPHASGGAACKHLWAILLVAEELGHLNEGPPPTSGFTHLEVVPPDVAVPTPPESSPAPPAPTDAKRLMRTLQRHIGERDAASPTASVYSTGELLYAFDAPVAAAGHGLLLSTYWRQRKTTGDWTKPRAVTLQRHELMGLLDRDRRVLAPVFGAQPSFGRFQGYGVPAPASDSFSITDALAPIVIPAVAATGRAFLKLVAGSDDLTPISIDDGPVWNFGARFERSDDGDYAFSSGFMRNGEHLASEAVLFVLNAGYLFTRDAILRLAPVRDFPLAARLASAGPVRVPAADARALSMFIARAGVAVQHLPEELRIPEIDVRPVPRLLLTTPRDDFGPTQLTGSLSFDYAGTIVNPGGDTISTDLTRLQIIHRRPAEEEAARALLRDTGFVDRFDAYERAVRLSVGVRHFPAAARTLIAAGWHVEAKGAVYRAAGGVRLAVSSGIDWFDLKGTVEFGTETAALTDILAALRRGETTIKLGDGHVGLLPEDWLRRYAPLAATGETHDGALRFSKPQTALLDALLQEREAHASITYDETFIRARREMLAFADIEPADPPASFRGDLRDYQRVGLGWFDYLRHGGFGGCLADDMGLGKTVMVLALLASRHAGASTETPRRPSVVVVPRSLVHNWIAEAARFTPSLRVLDYSGANRSSAEASLAACDVAFVTYGTLRKDATRLKDFEFDYIVLDEAQAIKNAATIGAKAARLLRGSHRLALTGTPIENHLGELWSLFEFLNPGLLGASSLFKKATASSGPDGETASLLARGLRPFILRRTKAQVARELPAKTELTIRCALSAKERTLYDGLRRHFRRTLQDRVARVGVGRSQTQILEALLRLRQAACHPGLLDQAAATESSAKFDVLLPRLAEVAEEGHKALVFSQFTSLLAILRARLDTAGLVYEYLDGRTRDRGARVERFQTDPACRLFLISLRAGGVGLNLTAAEYVFLLDPWWNPAVESQAIDRTHRIGQTREVFAYRLIAEDTVEERVLQLQETKRALADAVLVGDAGGLRGLTPEDVDLLLS